MYGYSTARAIETAAQLKDSVCALGEAVGVFVSRKSEFGMDFHQSIDACDGSPLLQGLWCPARRNKSEVKATECMSYYLILSSVHVAGARDKKFWV